MMKLTIQESMSQYASTSCSFQESKLGRRINIAQNRDRIQNLQIRKKKRNLQKRSPKERSIPEKGRSTKRKNIQARLSPNQSSSRKSFPRLNATKRMAPKVSICCLEPTFWATLMIWISA